MIHRDLNPENFQIDKESRCYISDFGSSWLLAGTQPLSRDKSIPGYVTPELYGDEEYTEKVDVFSFALVLYKILVGCLVYEGIREQIIMSKTITGSRVISFLKYSRL